jgi:N-acetylmuramoyl-L-alanine amidase
MRAWLCLWFCCIGVAIGSAANRPASRPSNIAAERFRFYGREFVRLSDWSRLVGLEVKWKPREKDIHLSGSTARIELTVDSNRAEFNGTRLLLCYPVIAVNGTAYLSLLDAQQSFRPLLSRSGPAPGGPIKTIVLDPGHGGKDPGFKIGSEFEKNYTLSLAKELQAQLSKAGYRVSLTRTTDSYSEPEERPEVAKRRSADLFISLHFNSATASVSGIETYCMTPAGASSSNAGGAGATPLSSPGNLNNDRNLLLAFHLQRTLTRELGAADRAVHRARFAVLREASMPAVLIEGGFLSNATEGLKIGDPAYRRQMAKAIVDGIQNYGRALGGQR